MKSHAEFKKQYLVKYGVSPVWDWIGYVLGAIPFVWLANKHDSWMWLLVAVGQGILQAVIGYVLIEKERKNAN